jgi:glycogen debranching enzyme/putative sterol carrier protein
VDDFRDEEPGKILHELRFGEMTAFEERPHSPYYGSADSTTLWLILLDEYERWTGRVDVVRALEPHARAALAWIDEYGDRDGDGYLEYDRRNKETGLENQCWKDSWNSILFSSGELAPLPRATCELQGYAYDAKMRCARLARDIWRDATLAERLEREAADLKSRFNRDFWLEDRGYFALALDGQKRQVDSLTSNIGHLLWSGIVDSSKAPQVAQHLLGEKLFSGWGVRTMASHEGGYNPIGYHVGTVWPHDNSMIAMGLVRYGFTKEASQVAEAILEAATYFHDRLPEAFAGYERALTHYPVEYPTACSPQAWATGAPLLLTRVILGMEAVGSRLASNPTLPAVMSQLEITGMPGRWGRESVGAHAADTILAAMGNAAAQPTGSVAELFARLDERVGSVAGRRGHASLRFDLDDGDSWRVALDEGKLAVGKSDEEADCVIETNEETLRDLLSGKQRAQTAVLSGKVKVHGDLAIAAKVGNLF